MPFLKKKEGQVAGIIMKTRSPDNPEENSNDSSAGLEACAKSLIQGIKMENPKQVAEALQSAFEIMESQPHEEYSEGEE